MQYVMVKPDGSHRVISGEGTRVMLANAHKDRRFVPLAYSWVTLPITQLVQLTQP